MTTEPPTKRAVDVSEHVVHIQRLTQALSEAREKEDWAKVAELAAMIAERAASIEYMAKASGQRRPR